MLWYANEVGYNQLENEEKEEKAKDVKEVEQAITLGHGAEPSGATKFVGAVVFLWQAKLE